MSDVIHATEEFVLNALKAKQDALSNDQLDKISNALTDASMFDKAGAAAKVKEYLLEEIGKIGRIEIRRVDVRPESGESGVLYLVPSATSKQENIYDEYLWIKGAWELIGSTAVDLSGYVKNDEDYSTVRTNAVTGAAHAADSSVHVTSAEKTKWNAKQYALTTQQLANIASVPQKRDKTNNICAKDELGKWSIPAPIVINGVTHTFNDNDPTWDIDFFWRWVDDQGGAWASLDTTEDDTDLYFYFEDDTEYGFNASRLTAKATESYVTKTGVRNIVKTDGETRTEITTLAEAACKVKHNAESTAVASVTLKDGDVASVTMSGTTLAIDFDDARATGGLRLCELYISGAAKDADLTFAEGETVVTDGNAFPKCEAGLNYYVFAEVAPNTWNVTRKTLQVVIPAPTTEG